MKNFKHLFSFFILINNLTASPFTIWKEFPTDPIYTPYSVNMIQDDYFPYVIFNADKFDGHGASYLYKMWHQGHTGIALSHSNDGINWILRGDVVVDPTIAPNVPLHAAVLYDKNGFGGTPFHYKLWYWTGTPNAIPPALNIKFTQSMDGVTWTTPVATTQDTTFYLVNTAISGTFFHQMYGFGQMIYNPNATSTPGEPFTFPYVTFFDSSAAQLPPQTTRQAVALAYSNDGLHWIRFSDTPVLIPSGTVTEWDGKYAYRATVISLNGTYHMFYSGASSVNNPNPNFAYTFGIGHASSQDGITWIKDLDNPIFTIFDPGQTWRSGRTLAPSVVIGSDAIDPSCNQSVFLQMWFSGGTNIPGALHLISFANGFASASIGYATLSLTIPTGLALACERMWLKKKKICRRV